MAEWVILLKDRIIRRFEIEEGECLAIGRSSDADITINNPSMSRKHTSLELKEGIYYLSDLHSMNGTWVNGKKIYADRPLRRTDNISIGKFTLKPTIMLNEEVEGGSVAADNMDIESQNETLYVTGIHRGAGKEVSAAKKRLLSVIAGKAAPTKLIVRTKSIKVGKDPAANLVISGALLPGTAFVIDYRHQGHFITPRPGIFCKIILNGKKISKPQLLKPMDIIEVGKTRFRFS